MQVGTSIKDWGSHVLFKEVVECGCCWVEERGMVFGF